MVDEVDQGGDTRECQRYGDGDREVRDKGRHAIPLPAHGAQHHQAIAEGADEGAEHHLRGDVPHEAVDQARTEMLRGHSEGDNSDRECQTHDGDG